MNETAIADHGLIGDLQTAALVSTDGAIDWFCCPRFDSPSVFGSLLDDERGGHFRVRPVGEPFTSQQMYHPDTAILITRFMTASGVCEVLDFMPVTGQDVTDNHRLVRMLRCVRGRVTMEFDIFPRFDYGRRPHETTVLDGGVVFSTDEMALTVHLVREPEDERLGHAEVDEGRVRATLPLVAGQVRGVVLESASAGPPLEIRLGEFQQMFDDTVAFWRVWLAQSTYTGRWREILQRSAITLKLMTYAPTGGLVAAPTAGLPEQVGGERNWDYRYSWVRDASFSVYALLGMGFTEEAAQFCIWLRDRVVERHGAPGNPLNIMYSVDGTADLPEVELEGWSGYRGSLPIRIGNAAAEQLQLDIYGEALDSIFFADAHGLEIGHAGWMALVTLLDWLTDNWDQPDDGIWESRGGRQDFTYGRLMCWVAFDRAIRLATSRARPASLDRWIAARDGIYEQIMARGWNAEKQAFVQHYASDVLDSALLRMGTVGFLSPYDPMWQSTLRAMDEELVTDGLVYRYDPSASPDGLQGSEGTFSLCSFTYVDALARAGRVDEARLAFEKILTYSNHVGLFSEEIALTGEQIGNFPQAFTHLSLIDAALTLDRALDRRRSIVLPRSGPVPSPAPPAPRVSPEAHGAPAPAVSAAGTGRTGNGRRDGRPA
jgi:GH15 family glucan-1,4-alpha-glucosidase